jgi:hypothetical protein
MILPTLLPAWSLARPARRRAKLPGKVKLSSLAGSASHRTAASYPQSGIPLTATGCHNLKFFSFLKKGTGRGAISHARSQRLLRRSMVGWSPRSMVRTAARRAPEWEPEAAEIAVLAAASPDAAGGDIAA